MEFHYTVNEFLQIKDAAIICPVLSKKLESLFSSTPCFQSTTLTKADMMGHHRSMVQSSGGRRSNNNHHHPRSRKNQPSIPPSKRAVPEPDPKRQFHGLLNKMSASNVESLTKQMMAMIGALDVTYIVHTILEQSSKQSIYYKQFVQALATVCGSNLTSNNMELINMALAEHIASFMKDPLFVVEGIVDVESYDEFCERVKARSVALGRLRTIIEILDYTLFSTSITSEGFVTWYMSQWAVLFSKVDLVTVNASMISIELFLEGYAFILSRLGRNASTKLHIEYVNNLYLDLTKQATLPIKLKFKVMDMNDMLKKKYVPPSKKMNH